MLDSYNVFTLKLLSMVIVSKDGVFNKSKLASRFEQQITHV